MKKRIYNDEERRIRHNQSNKLYRSKKENKVKINKRRRERYHNDTEYREQALKSTKNNRLEHLNERHEYDKLYNKKNNEYIKQRKRNYYLKLKITCFLYYSKNDIKCNCCSENNIEFLSIDHINGGGTKHKKSICKSGNGIYKWLIDNNFPEGYQILCMNCNWAKGLFGYCPHIDMYKSNQYRLLCNNHF